jgi:hypothetical protein
MIPPKYTKTLTVTAHDQPATVVARLPFDFLKFLNKTVLRIRIRMFFGLLDPDLLVRRTDPDSPVIKQK